MFNTFLLAATGADFNSFGAALEDLAEQLFNPLIGIAIALCAIWGVYLGFKFWRADDEKKREEAKKAVIAFVVGIIVIFAVAVAAPLLIGALTTWMETQQVM